MANDYKPGKFAGVLEADITGNKTKTTVTLGDDYDSALSEVKKQQKAINTTLDSIRSVVDSIDKIDHGKGYNIGFTHLKKYIKTIRDKMDTSINKMNSAVNSAQREEWNYYKKLLDQWLNAQNSTSASATGSSAASATTSGSTTTADSTTSTAGSTTVADSVTSTVDSTTVADSVASTIDSTTSTDSIA